MRKFCVESEFRVKNSGLGPGAEIRQNRLDNFIVTRFVFFDVVFNPTLGLSIDTPGPGEAIDTPGPVAGEATR